jgi:NADPH-dependent 2,4-dienoyl-CoA reductase/sulfur reductase-like enzyme
VLGFDNIWAGGDCVESYHRLLRRTVHMPLGTHANKQGRVMGLNVAGGYATFPGIIGTAITKVGTTHIARTGLSTAQAAEAGFDVVSAAVGTSVIAGYMPDAGRMGTKVIAERGTGRLLGGQIVGNQVGAAKRIDTLAMAIWTGFTAEELTSADLSYAPPSSPVWDPVQVAARAVTSKV